MPRQPLQHAIDLLTARPMRPARLISVIAILLLAATGLVYATGGTKHPFSHLLYLPVLLAAFVFKAPGGALAGLAAGVLLGPLMPRDVELALPQTTAAWTLRAGFFVLTGTLIGYASQRMAQRLQEAHHTADELATAYARTLRTFASLVASRDEQTAQHGERIAHNACLVGEALGLPEEELELLYWAGILHDLGKLEIPAPILLKDGKLTPEEFAVIRKHPVLGAEILLDLSSRFHPIAAGVRSHHERWDGNGYPDGLAGDAIPLFGRILAVVDVLEALTSKRPYREAIPAEDALAFLEEQAGTQFDPTLIPVLVSLFDRGYIQLSSDESQHVRFKEPPLRFRRPDATKGSRETTISKR